MARIVAHDFIQVHARFRRPGAALSTSSASPTEVVIESSATISQRPNSVLEATRALSQVWLIWRDICSERI